MLLYVAAVLSLVLYILCIYYVHACCVMLICHFGCLARALEYIYAHNYISTASAHTSKLPPQDSVVLNMMMQCSHSQVTSGDQFNSSSDMSTAHVKPINGE